jgi:hypothetical protein
MTGGEGGEGGEWGELRYMKVASITDTEAAAAESAYANLN